MTRRSTDPRAKRQAEAKAPKLEKETIKDLEPSDKDEVKGGQLLGGKNPLRPMTP
jgi:hypothetical protein